MNFKQIGNKRDEILMTVQNWDQSTVTTPIAPGVPLVLQYAGPENTNFVGNNGLGVVLPSSAPGGAAQVNTCFYGVNTSNMYYQGIGTTMVDGYYNAAVVVLQTRAATTNSWAATTLANWALLTVDNVNNAFAVAATTGAMSYQAAAVLLGALSVTGTASSATVSTNTNVFTGLASNATDTRTVITTSARIQVRCL